MAIRLLFRADDGSTGGGLWVTDGTTAGTVLVKNINPGPDGSGPDHFAALGDGRLVFSTDDGSTGRLWVTDGTTAGTTLLKDINLDSDPAGTGTVFAALGDGRLVFAANDGSTGDGLWVTDGTTAGTTLLKDINPAPGPRHNNLGAFAALGDGRLVFAADDGSTGREPWVTDGTTAGTTLLKDINPGPDDSLSFLNEFIALGDGRLVFHADDGSTGRELWVTDGTTAGTTLLKDINPGPDGSFPGFPPELATASRNEFAALGDGRRVFTADDGSTGFELWVTDGTTAGTTLLKDINPGPDGSFPAFFAPLGDGRLVFAANDGSTGREPWVTDGTTEGTTLLKDINPGPGRSLEEGEGSFTLFAALGDGRLVFAARDGSTGDELWVTDGTTAGTTLLKDINTGGFAALGDGRLVFNAFDGSTGQELWVTDGTTAGTTLLKDINPGVTGPDFAALGDGRLVFAAFDGSTGMEPWVTDGTTAGTTLLKDINPGPDDSGPDHFAALGGGRLASGASAAIP